MTRCSYQPNTGENAGQNAGQLVRLLAGSRQDRGQAENDVPKYPEDQDHAYSDGAANCGSRLSSLAGCAIELFTDRAQVRNKPNDHQNIEGYQSPFEELPEKATLGFSYRMPAMRAVECLGRDFVVATRASGQLGHAKSFREIQSKHESTASHSGLCGADGQGGIPAQIRGQRSPQIGRSLHSGAETWSNVEGRCCAMSHEPSRNELGT